MSRWTANRPDTVRSIVWALGANVAIAVAKLGGAWFTGSGALLAETLHSLADSVNEALLLYGRRQARTPPSAHHPLGHGRATYFWSFVVALLLFSLGGLFSIYEGVRKLDLGEPVEAPWVAVAIVLFAVAAEGLSLRTALRQIGKVRRDRSLWRWFRETRRSELIVVLTEDVAAITGLCLALAALLVTIATGDPLWDAIGSIAIGTLLMVVASGLAAETKSLLIGESASPRTRRAIRNFLRAQPAVGEIEQLVTMQHGDDLLVAVRARMRDRTSAGEVVDAIASVKAALQAEFPQAMWIFFEPTATSERTAAVTRRAAHSRGRRSRRHVEPAQR
jgi:cation diffusion facilitator family transporter